MPDRKEILSAERKFLHDLASPLTIARLTSVMLLEDLRAIPSFSGLDKTLDRLIRLASSIESMEKLHAQRKEEIYILESV